MPRSLSVLALIGVAILSAALPAHGAAAESRTGGVPWRHGNAETFRSGSPEEGGRYSAVGLLPVTIHRPAAEGVRRSSFSCTAAEVSATTRCGRGGPSHGRISSGSTESARLSWTAAGGRRLQRAGLVRGAALRRWGPHRRDGFVQWWADRPGRASHDPQHPAPFVAGVALYPGCQSDVEETF